MKRVLLLLMLIIIYFKGNVMASSEGVKIKTENIEEEYTVYAKNHLNLHLQSILETKDNNILDYYLGSPFTVKDIVKNKNIIFYPVINNSQVEYLFIINKKNGEFNASLGKYFSDELINLFNESINKEYALLLYNNQIYNYDGRNITLLYSFNNKFNLEEYNKLYKIVKNRSNIYNNENLVNKVRLLSKNNIYYLRKPTPSAVLLEGKTLNVKGVAQGDNQCWAATIAAMINYKKDKSLSAYTVAKYIYPNNPYQGGDWYDMKKAYNNWGIYPSQIGKLSFGSVKKYINSYKPQHLRLYLDEGHSVGLIGYYHWDLKNGDYERTLVLLEPNRGVRNTVILKSNNNFNYWGSYDVWQNTIILP